MPKKFIKAERAIEKSIRNGKIPKFYYDKNGTLRKTNPYALARRATSYRGITFHAKKLKGGLYS